MSTESHQAELLARWLSESPAAGVRSEPPSGLDTDVVDAVSALQPDRAPPPRVDIDDILFEVADGPLAELVDPAAVGALGVLLAGREPPPGLDPDVLDAVSALRPEHAPAPRVTIDDILAEVTAGPLAAAAPATVEAAPTPMAAAPLPPSSPEEAVPLEAPANTQRGASRMPRWLWPSLGGLAVAATALLFVAPMATSTMDAPPASQAEPRYKTAQARSIGAGDLATAPPSEDELAEEDIAEMGIAEEAVAGPARLPPPPAAIPASPRKGGDAPSAGSSAGPAQAQAEPLSKKKAEVSSGAGLLGGLLDDGASGAEDSDDARLDRLAAPDAAYGGAAYGVGAAPVTGAMNTGAPREEEVASPRSPAPEPEPAAAPATAPSPAGSASATRGPGAAPADAGATDTLLDSDADEVRQAAVSETLSVSRGTARASRSRPKRARRVADAPMAEAAPVSDAEGAGPDLATLRDAAWAGGPPPSTRSIASEGWTAVDRSRESGDATRLVAALEALVDGPQPTVAQEAAGALAQLHLVGGRTDLALAAVARGLGRSGGHPLARPWLLAIQGDALARRGDTAGARASYLQALETR